MTRYTLATNARRRLITRTPRPLAVLPPGIVAGMWPPAPRWLPGRTGWNLLRAATAAVWANRWTGHRHPHLCRLGWFVWTVTALAAMALALTVTLAATVVWPLRWATSRAAGAWLVLAGWTPPLPEFDPSPVDAADLVEPPVPTPELARMTPTGPGDPWDWNTAHDPHLAVQREAVAELRRSNDLAAAQHHHQTHPQPLWTPPGPVPTIAYHAPQRAGPAGRSPWSGAKALLGISIALGAVFAIGAWALAWLSALGTIPAPPTWDQLEHPNTPASLGPPPPPTTQAPPTTSGRRRP